MSVAESDGHTFSMGRVVGNTFGVIVRNISTIGILILVAVVPLFFVTLATSRTAFAPTDNPLDFFQFGLMDTLSLLLSLLSAFVMQAAIMHATIRDLNKQPVRFG